VTERQRNLIDDLNLIENPQERLSILVDRARHLPPLPAETRSDKTLVPGCVSQVWLLCERDTAGRCYFRCDADSPLVKALVAFLCDYYNGCTPAEILAEIATEEAKVAALDERPAHGTEPRTRSPDKRAEDASPLAALGLLQTLSATRRNGLAQVRARIQAFAAASEANSQSTKPPRNLANHGSEHAPLLLYDAHTHSPALNGLATLSVLNGSQPADWPTVAARAAEHPDALIPSYGLHPWYCATAPNDWLAQIRTRLLTDPRAQIGEIGLDRALIRRSEAASIEAQLAALNAQLALAAELDRVATIHCVQAHGLLLDTLHNAPKLPRLLLHSYSGSAQMIRDFAALGAYFSFGASVLDPRRERLLNALRATPPERLLVETDTPAGLSYATNTLEQNHWALASLLGQPVEQLTARVAANFQRLFLSAG